MATPERSRPHAPPDGREPRGSVVEEFCPACGGQRLASIKCKLVCLGCRVIVMSCCEF